MVPLMWKLVLAVLLGPGAFAAPLTTRSLSSDAALSGVIESLVSDVGSLLQGITDPATVLSAIESITPLAAPTSIDGAQSILQLLYNETPSNLYERIAVQQAAGLGPSDLSQVLATLSEGENSSNNNNPRKPADEIYPKKSSADAPFSLTEEQLQAAIYIPSGFTYGAKPPTIFVPGTGAYGGINFGTNLRKLLTDVSYADPVWLNIPNAMLADAQVNSEYIAYAINYISGISGSRNVSIISWSQGGLDTQWALTFWPSARSKVSDFLPVSPDFHGTILADLLCLTIDGSSGLGPCDPSVSQQQYTSKYITALRSRGGDSAYVPTTVFYSGLLDEVVQPQQGTGASAYLGDARGVGVINVELQTACLGQPGGSFYEHAGVLYASLTYALIVDALTHDGPGDLSRIDLNSVCAQYAAPGLTLVDTLATIALIPIALAEILAYPDKSTAEPQLMAYVQ
ncbi:hypothetical protein BX600DRAFT_32636 [Xylariales sp. PMI_506]|nr:hypothetical protein BX600DRAFT_32636 [Xylariales sp. PMI_506]